MTPISVQPRTVQVWSDIGCPWAHVAVWRLHDARRQLGLQDRVRFDHRVFPLELFNSRPTPRNDSGAEFDVCRALAPQAGWRAWAADASTWPVTLLPAMEAVQAAKEQGLAASEELDRGLRRAFWAESRCISLRHVILEVASETETIDLAALAEAMDAGRARRQLFDQWEVAKTDQVSGSPHIFTPDGWNAQNPGIEASWEEVDGEWVPTIVADDGAAYVRIVRTAAA